MKEVNVKNYENEELFFLSCLNGFDTLISRKNSLYSEYIRSCIYSNGHINKPIFGTEFYKSLINASLFKLNEIADKLYYLNYPLFFKVYNRKRVEFYRLIIRYKIAKIYYEEGKLKKSIEILNELIKEKEPRVRFISLKLLNQIYSQLQSKLDTTKVYVSLKDGFYIKNRMICELDFPETLVVKNGELIYWSSPIIQ
jgi:hypothetical protein